MAKRMTRKFSPYLNGQVLALTGAIALHCGIAAWAAQPSTPTIMPQQQVIQISMISPAFSVPTEPETAQTKSEPAPATPPKENGMKKAEPRPKKHVTKPQPQQPKAPEKLTETASATPPTTGAQSPKATEQSAARTEPVFNAAYLQNPSPVYPSAARRKGIEGKVMLEVKVSAEGTARNVAIAMSSGSTFLDEAAREAVLRWHFQPARLGKETIEAKVIVPVEFKLN